jgi:hypothetical protein
MHGVWYIAPRIIERDGEAFQTRRVLFQQYVDPVNETRYFAKDQTTMLGRWATIRDPDNPDGVMMPELIAMMNGAEKKPPRKTRGGKS